MQFCDKIFSVQQIQDADAYTIKEANISSLQLMEQAAMACVNWILKNAFSGKRFAIVCGKGNNGGDGLAIARLLSQNPNVEKIDVFILHSSAKYSANFHQNYQQIQQNPLIKIHNIAFDSDIEINAAHFDFLLDAIIGSGLSAPISGWLAKKIEYINNLHLPVISIDIPSGLFTQIPPTAEIVAIKAQHTLSFQFPKLSFMFCESAKFVGTFSILPIGISKNYIEATVTKNYYITQQIASHILKQRDAFSHKGNFGHALIVAGSYGKMGAAVLASKACLRSGAGLLSVHIPRKGIDVLQISFPEAMLSIDSANETVSSVPQKITQYNAVAIGPGLGTEMATQKVLYSILNEYKNPLVIDADALNILSGNREWVNLLPENSILTPHVKEFERLTTSFSFSFNRLEAAKTFAVKNIVIVVLKGAHTAICVPNGDVYFNSTGNPGMATAGSGDVLTGVITAFLAQKYTPLEAALLGVFLHGRAGDNAASEKGQESVIASDIIENLTCLNF